MLAEWWPFQITRGWKADSSMGQDKKVNEVAMLISKHTPLLTYHQVAAVATTIVDSVAVTAIVPAAARNQKTHSMLPV